MVPTLDDETTMIDELLGKDLVHLEDCIAFFDDI
jgi:hypothetical protein